MKNGMGSHQSSNMISDIWLTPPWIIDRLKPFDLDPCSAIKMPWEIAANKFTINDDGLSKEWFGFVWMNPPYGRDARRWLKKMADHNNGIALIFARTETEMFVESVWGRASSMLFIHGRLHFHHENGEMAKANSGAPSVLIGYGEEADNRLKTSGINGTFVQWGRQ